MWNAAIDNLPFKNSWVRIREWQNVHLLDEMSDEKAQCGIQWDDEFDILLPFDGWAYLDQFCGFGVSVLDLNTKTLNQLIQIVRFVKKSIDLNASFWASICLFDPKPCSYPPIRFCLDSWKHPSNGRFSSIMAVFHIEHQHRFFVVMRKQRNKTLYSTQKQHIM